MTPAVAAAAPHSPACAAWTKNTETQLNHLGLLIVLLGVYGALLVVRQALRYYQAITREYLAGTNMRQLDLRTTELFLEKSLGMHVIENNYLNADLSPTFRSLALDQGIELGKRAVYR